MPARDADEPSTPRRLRVGMPHLDAAGLSENWLFRYAGELHWEAIGERLGAASDAIESAWGQRLYATFVAVRARYDVPLAHVRENDRLDANVEVVPCGRACAHGRVRIATGAGRLSLELLSTFAARDGSGELRMALPAARLAARWTVVEPAPPIARVARAARRGETVDDAFCGPALADAGASGRRLLRCEPSPYAHYNGAGLLYFASYVTLADDAERALVDRAAFGVDPRRDWALATSPVARDVFYYANLPLGEALTADLVSCRAEPRGGVTTRVRLARATGEPMADVVTRRAFVDGEARAR